MQGSILALAGLLVRFIGMLYRIPMISIIGSEGIGYYTSAFSLYSLFLILSSYSFPTAISKLISFRLANNRYADCKTIFICSFFMAFVVGSLMFLLMYFGADLIAILYQKPLLSFSLRALAPTLFIMAFLSVFRGIFQGTGNMVPTAISQIFEQVVNAVFSILLSYIFFNKGKIANIIYNDTEYTYAFGAKGGAIGTGLGAFVALCILIFLFFNLVSNYKYLFKNNNYFQLETKKEVYHNLIITIIPIIMSTTLYNLTSVIDDLIYSNIETFFGNYSNIVSMWGLYGQFHLLFNIPVAISNSLTSSVIPSLSQSVALKDAKGVVKKTKYSIKYTLLIVLPAFCGMTVLAEPICKLLFFNTTEMDILISMVEIGSISIVFFSLSTITNGILQGLGLFNVPVKNGIIALIIHIICLFIMLIPLRLGINAIISQEQFPADLQDRAASMSMFFFFFDRIGFFQQVLRNLEAVYKEVQSHGFEPILQEWRQLSVTLGEEVNVLGIKETFSGRAVDIAEDGALLIDVGTEIRPVYAGDVSIRPKS